MSDYHIEIINDGKKLPQLSDEDFFHSTELFHLVERSSDCTPYMIVAYDSQGIVHAHLLALLWRRGSLLPPYLFSQGRVYGEGVYLDETEKKDLFPLLLKAVSRAFHHKMCLYIEFSDLSSKMFGYREFRRHQFFPVTWMQIKNSLHSMAPEERLSDQTLRLIERGYKAGIITREAESDDEIRTFHKMIKNYYKFKIHRFIPSAQFFINLSHSSKGRIFITLWHDKIIGGSAVVCSHHNSYLWFVASRKKSHPVLHPEVLTVWHDIRSSYDLHLRHICFMNVGLPFRVNRYREFILSFGGKPMSTYRWFHFTLPWLNKFLSWFFRE